MVVNLLRHRRVDTGNFLQLLNIGILHRLGAAKMAQQHAPSFAANAWDILQLGALSRFVASAA